MGLMSIESQEAVKCYKDYVAAKLIEDPNDLWKIIVDTHLTNCMERHDDDRSQKWRGAISCHP